MTIFDHIKLLIELLTNSQLNDKVNRGSNLHILKSLRGLLLSCTKGSLQFVPFLYNFFFESCVENEGLISVAKDA